MQYDPRWEEKDFLKARATCLAQAESVIVSHCKRMVRTPEDLYYYKIACEKARQKANQQFSLTYWAELKSRHSR